MSTFAESFLGDLDELSSGDEAEQPLDTSEGPSGDSAECSTSGDKDEDGKKKKNLDAKTSTTGIQSEEVNTKERVIANVAFLRRSDRYKNHVKQVKKYLDMPASINHGVNAEEDPEYLAVLKSNDLMVEIDDEMMTVYRLVIDLYQPKFPELESLVQNPIDYVHVVQKIGNETDMTLVDLSDLLPNPMVMSVSVTGSTTSGKPLSTEALRNVQEATEEFFELDKEKKEILSFVESRMNFLAPNVSALVGTRLAAQLVGIAGGLTEFTRIPSSNVQVLGQQKKALGGFSSTSTVPHTGIIYFADLIQDTPEYLRRKALRQVAGKVALAARVDAARESMDGEQGRKFRAFLEEKFEKWQEHQQAKTVKALPVPDEKPRRKRGGKRYRKMKARLEMTDVRRDANRVTFADADDEYGDSAMGVGFGRLGKEGTGNLRVIKKNQKQPTKKLKTSSYATNASGLQSSLAFTPVQGIELMNPEMQKERVKQANKKYFSGDSGFVSVKRAQ